MENFILDQVKYGLKYVPANLAKSYFIKNGNSETENFRKKGFMRGICHPSEDFEMLKGANLEWIRIDIPYPFNEDGTLTQSYTDFRKKAERIKAGGMKLMAVTPLPVEFLRHGIDARKKEDIPEIERVSRFLVTDLQGLVGAMQIANEIGIPRFTLPFSVKEGAEFIAVTAKAMYPVRGDILVGYNSAGPQSDLNLYLKPYMQYFDYIGIDLYMGCFFFGTMWMFDALLRYLWAFTGKPIVLCEFGYISAGAPKSKKEKLDIIRSYGMKNKKDAKNNINKLLDNMPEHMSRYIKHCAQAPERYANYVFLSEFTNHFYKELPKTCVIPGYPHTPEGQAKFYHEILPRLYKYGFLGGLIIYCWSDSEKCYVCGQDDCPTETRWGLVDCNGNPKPSYYAVRDEFSKIKWIENLKGNK